ncbi:MAG: c-type cytochrome [Candidatus Binatia bacterium]
MPRVLLVSLLLATVWPQAAAAAEDRYQRWCARCHGTNGDGSGPAAVALAFNGRPARDFRSGEFKFKSTAPGEPPAEGDLERTIAEGLPGTAMPYFKDVLSHSEIRALAADVRGFASSSDRPPGKPVELGEPPPDDPEVLERGARLYLALGCPECHGADGTGGPEVDDLVNADGTRAIPTDLTRPWRFRGGGDERAVALRLASGIAGTPMPSYWNAAPPSDLAAVARYVVSRARAGSLRDAAIEAARNPPGATEAPAARGEYVAKSGTCFLCHVQMNPDGSYAEGSFGAGGMKVEIKYVGTTYSRNLTPDLDTGIGRWTSADFRRVFRGGTSRNGRMLNPLDMPWTILAGLGDDDIDALFAYFRTLDPVRNAIPPPEAPGFVEGVVEKSVALVTGSHDDANFAFHPRNYGREAAGEPTEEPQNPRAPILLAVGCAAVLALVPRAKRGRMPAIVALIAIPIVYIWPPVTFLPAGLLLAESPYEPVARLLNLPPLRPPPEPQAIGDPGLARLAERGRYVATLGTCSLCHTAGPTWMRLWSSFPDLGGGMKVNWNVFGTTYSRNLTPDRETGLGTWSAEEIRRAITSGIAKDGRIMHWQAMPWDHFSNLTLEDLEALVFYLQSLEPAYSKVPPPEPPRADDLPSDSFWLGYSGEFRPRENDAAR